MPAADGTDAVLAAFPDRLVAVAEHLQTAPEHAAAVAAALGPLAEGLALSSSADRGGDRPDPRDGAAAGSRRGQRAHR
ncbi:hypothetical protein [Rothia kristinae]|uniref:hypothetical protein n=1 Tax=Rothia kristinae TaxID=37923 RepID=UPI0018CBA617|nr:hypothetical protein [Rothia kristinae]